MKYQIAICDDEQGQTEYISSVLSAWGRQNRHTCDIRAFCSAEAFLFDYTENKTYDHHQYLCEQAEILQSKLEKTE